MEAYRIRMTLSVSCITRQSLELTRTSEGKAEEITGTLEHELASRTVVDSWCVIKEDRVVAIEERP